MLKATILVLAIVIVVRDFKTHRISNWHLILITLFLIFDAHCSPLKETLIAILVTTAVFAMGRIGMGDIKLATALLATQGSIILTRAFVTYLLLALQITVVLALLKYRQLRGSVAFSQVILLPFLALYLAI